MNNILQWETERSRVWGNARIENIQRLRDDLATLAEWIKGKADAASLATKADLSKILELEKRLSTSHEGFQAFRQEGDKLVDEWRQRLGQLEAWAEEGKTSLAECRRIDEGLREVETESRSAMAQAVARCEEQAGIVSDLAKAARTAADESASLKESCSQSNLLHEEKSGAFESLVQQHRQHLDALAATVEENASKVERLAQSSQEALLECQSKADEARVTQTTADVQLRDLEARIADWLRQGQAYADTAADNARATGLASELASNLRTECEGIIQTLQLKSEELSSTWQSMERDFADLSNRTQQEAAKASESARSAEEMLLKCQTSAQASSELSTTLQASEAQIKQQITRLDELLSEAGRHITASSEHLQALQKRDAQRVEAEAQLRALAQRIEARSQETNKESREFLQTSGTFWGRLKWLLRGNRSA